MYSSINDSLQVVFDLSWFNVAHQHYSFFLPTVNVKPAGDDPDAAIGIVKVITLQQAHHYITGELEWWHICCTGQKESEELRFYEQQRLCQSTMSPAKATETALFNDGLIYFTLAFSVCPDFCIKKENVAFALDTNSVTPQGNS